jgi:hypothetical protein
VQDPTRLSLATPYIKSQHLRRIMKKTLFFILMLEYAVYLILFVVLAIGFGIANLLWMLIQTTENYLATISESPLLDLKELAKALEPISHIQSSFHPLPDPWLFDLAESQTPSSKAKIVDRQKLLPPAKTYLCLPAPPTLPTNPLLNLSSRELKQLASQNQIKGYGKMTKAQLLEQLTLVQA